MDNKNDHEGRLSVAITGAAGAVGHYLVAQAASQGHHIIAVDLPEADFPQVEGIEIRRGDLTRRRFCRKAVEGADVVLHTAAANDSGAVYNTLSPINVDAVRWLYEAAEDEGVGRFVHLSSAGLYRPKRGVLNEQSDIEATTPYEETKQDAERYLTSRPSSAIPWTILRPSLAYGPRCQRFGAGVLTVPPLLRMFFTYVPGLTGGSRNNWVHVEDIASACLLVATCDEAACNIYNVADDTPLAYGEILSAVIQSYGLQIGPSFPFPLSLLVALSPFISSEMMFKFMTGLLGPLWKRIEHRYKLVGPLRPNVYRAGLAYLQGDRVVVTDRLKALGWTPRWRDLRQGMAETIRWYQGARWVPDYRALPEEDILEEGIRLSYQEHFACDFDRDGDLSLTVTFPDVRKLAFAQDASIEGTISLEGIATNAPLMGTLKVFKARRDMLYEFTFNDDQGEGHRFSSHKHLTLLGLAADFARLEGTLVNTRGAEIATLRWRMSLKEDLGTLLRSIHMS